MEKDEKIQQLHSQRKRTLVLLSAAAVVAMMLGVVFLGNDESSSSSLPSQVRKSVRQGIADIRTHEASLEHYAKKSLADIRQQQQHHDPNNDVEKPHRHEQQRKALHERRHVDHIPELDVAANQHNQPQQQQQTQESEQILADRVAEYDKNVREIKTKVDANGGFMETDPEGVASAKALQEATRQLLKRRYGPSEPYRVKLDLEFQPSNPTFAADGNTDSFTIEMAPARLMPHAVFSFLEIARHWDEKRGAFHRRANHVLQVMVGGRHVPHLAFQEYSPEFPHKKETVGYAGRPSGPAWYVSIMDNSKNHGPGSQQARNPHEADACFGKVVEGFDRVVMGRITKMPGSGFLKPPMHVKITKMTILVPGETDGSFVPWTGSDMAKVSSR